MDRRYRLDHELALRLRFDGALMLWDGRRYWPTTVGEIELLGLMAEGRTTLEAAQEGGFAANAEVEQLVDSFVERGLLTSAVRSAPGTIADAEDGPAEPIFILGCPRSGTTLVRWLVDAHPRICCPAETHILVNLREFFESNTTQRAMSDLGVAEGDLLRRMRELYGGIMTDLAVRAGKTRWADKTPRYGLYPSFVHELFEGRCRFLIVVRHGLDVAASLAEAMARGSWGRGMRALAPPGDDLDQPLFTGARIWARFSRSLRQFRAVHPESVHVVRYEDLVADPERVAGAMFGSLGERMDDGLLVRAFQVDHGPGQQDWKILQTRGVERDHVGRWRSWPRAVIDALAEVVEPELQAWGYEAADRS